MYDDHSYCNDGWTKRAEAHCGKHKWDCWCQPLRDGGDPDSICTEGMKEVASHGN